MLVGSMRVSTSGDRQVVDLQRDAPTERPPAALLAFVADQIGVFPDAIDEYLATARASLVTR